jgi:hypothetical protein
MTNLEPTPRFSVIDALEHLFAEIDPSTDDEIDEVIRAAGIDPEAYAAKAAALASSIIREMGRKQLENARERYDHTTPSNSKGRQDTIQKIQELLLRLGGQSRPAFAHYRNLDAASDADLEGLLNDLTFLSEGDEPLGKE